MVTPGPEEPGMTREEATRWLATMKWVLSDAGRWVLAGEVEGLEVRLPRFGPGDARAYADLMSPPGRHRVHLVLMDPYEARAWALLRAILRSVP